MNSHICQKQADMGHPQGRENARCGPPALTQPENLSVQVNGNNQITSASGVSYDAAGEMTVDNLGNHFAYDGEGRILTVNTPSNSYVYDGSGYRVKKTTSGGTTLYWPGADGSILNESNSTASSFGRQVYLNGLMIWHEDTTGAGLFLFQDHLGSVRVTADASGNVKDDIDYLPFGAIYKNYAGTGSDNHYQFTETEKDSESSSSYMMYRNLSWSLARWNRPDPWDGSYDFSNPQSLNRYSYVMNRPMVLIDPSGLDCVYSTDEGIYILPGDCGSIDGYYIPGTVDKGGVTWNSDGSVALTYTPYDGSAGVAILQGAWNPGSSLSPGPISQNNNAQSPINPQPGSPGYAQAVFSQPVLQQARCTVDGAKWGLPATSGAPIAAAKGALGEEVGGWAGAAKAVESLASVGSTVVGEILGMVGIGHNMIMGCK